MNAINKKAGIYCGFDPTSDSLHLGNLMQIILLYRCLNAGLQPIAIIGGATAMIGDPSGKSQERNLLSKEQLNANINAISEQLTSIINQKITTISTKELLKMTNLLSLNQQERFTNKQMKTAELLAICQNLPLPLQELNLTNAEMIKFLQACQFPEALAAIYKLKNQPINNPEIYLEK